VRLGVSCSEGFLRERLHSKRVSLATDAWYRNSWKAVSQHLLNGELTKESPQSASATIELEFQARTTHQRG
jgi:hypothetical protein